MFAGKPGRGRTRRVNRHDCITETSMDYLIDCVCGHDLTRHNESGCFGNDSSCKCVRTRLDALDSAIDQARINPWGDYVRKPPQPGPDVDAA